MIGPGLKGRICQAVRGRAVERLIEQGDKDVMTAKRSVMLEVAGHRLGLKTDRDDSFLDNLAGYVSDQVRELRQAAPRAPMDKVCLLVALQIADELFAERAHNQALTEEIERRSEAVLSLLERELGAEAGAVASPSYAETQVASVKEPARRR